ncbi:phage repressor protein C with HTH and peptisase S24 domain [Pseudoduganella lurida]|uniref:Phage repressor protein C with HTH and peptisase S24 domain n=1 Tax=Pseudoduganella lurida TaxID=1036180 RepID=A0A562R7Y4_9BURK|nr:S24 family peptidase [Pseudoduganella lurida]TWI65188.1 phage repressor protein C with HTH and peptisase S24 domain [Pseudoduganella lurida]
MNESTVVAFYTCAYSRRMDIATRLDKAMKAAGFESQSALSRASGVPQPTINRILKSVGSKGPESGTLQKLAAACNVSFTWLHEGLGSPEESLATPLPPGAMRVVVAEDDDPHFYQIPRVQLQLQAGITGFKTVPEIYDGAKLSIPRHWADKKGFNPKKLIALTVKGESMEPNLFDGDVVIVNTGDTQHVDGFVYAINYEGEAVVKRLTRDAGRWWLSSDNPDQARYQRKSCHDGECLIVGRVVRRETEHI